MKNVICVDDRDQPTGACVVKGTQYIVDREYNNALDQKVYIINGIINEGITKMGMRWVGYRATRFKVADEEASTKKEYKLALN